MYQADENRYEEMKYNRCGASGLLLPAVSLGLWHNFGSNGNFDNMLDMCHTAFDHGITHFDLANNYGPVYGAAEENFGRILKKENKPAILVTHDISEAISMADRVIILTKRPAHVARIVPIRLSLDEKTPLAARGAPEFKSYFNLIWKELNQYA